MSDTHFHSIKVLKQLLQQLPEDDAKERLELCCEFVAFTVKKSWRKGSWKEFALLMLDWRGLDPQEASVYLEDVVDVVAAALEAQE